MRSHDTIAALASAAGRAAVGIVRVSGSEVPRIAAAVLGALPAPRHALLTRFRDHDGTSLDEGLALYFSAPASYTGEHVLELQSHGGAVVLDMILQRLLALGCRLARPGEFSERAFLNGKIDLARAEGVADLIDAGTAAAARAAVRTLQGEFSTRILALQSSLTELRTYVEAAIDFPDEEIDFLSDSALDGRLLRVLDGFTSIAAAARQGALLREGVSTVIAGRPNAGKSSLLNRLVGDDVAIVTDLPGTTRDVLRYNIHLDGLPMTLIDTAGLREAVDTIEQEGIRRARVEIERADHLLYVLDSTLIDTGATFQLPPEVRGFPPQVFITLVMNKIDMTQSSARIETDGCFTRVYLSAKSGAGLQLLRAHLKERAGFRDLESGVFSARRRHLQALEQAKRLVDEAMTALHHSRAFELFAEDLRLAQRALGEITGEFSNEDLLGEIFGNFCIGK